MPERRPPLAQHLHHPQGRRRRPEGDAGCLGKAGSERAVNETQYPLPEPGVAAALAAISFNAYGLVAAIAQQHDTGEVLIMAWLNAESVAATLRNGRVCYWSRSRKELWRKGATSGQQQVLKQTPIDCDGDTQSGRAADGGRVWQE